MTFRSFRPKQDKVGTFSVFSDTWLIELKSNVLGGIWADIYETQTLPCHVIARSLSTHGRARVCVCVWSCMVVPKVKVKSACRVLLPINPKPRSCPSRCLSPFSTQQTCKHYWSPPLRLSLPQIVSLSLTKSPSKSYRGNSQKKIDICLVNSLTTIKDTVGLMIKALMETIYAAEEAAHTKPDRQQSYLFHLFIIEHTSCCFLVQAFLTNGFTAPAQPHTVPMSSVNEVSLSKPFLSAKLGEKENLKTSTGLHINFTLKSGCW